MTVAVLATGALGILRSRRWTARNSRPRKLVKTLTALRLLPYAGVLALVAAFPRIAGSAFGGRAVSRSSAAYAWPAALILVLAVAIATVGTLGARGWQLALTS